MPEITQYSAIAIIVMFLIKEMFSFLKAKKNGNGKQDSKQDVKLAVIEEKVREIEENHLPHINKRLENIENKIDKIYQIIKK